MCLILLLTASTQAQTARVVELSASDTAQAKALYVEQEALTKRTIAFRESIQKRYLYDPSVPARSFSPFKEGWDIGFQYSVDFRFIVPLPAPIYYPAATIGGVGTLYCTNFAGAVTY